MAQISRERYKLTGLTLGLQETDQSVSGYIFDINGAGQYVLQKYNSNAESSLKAGTTTINNNQANTLKVIAHDNTYLFYVNNQLVQLQGTPDHSFTDNDQPFTGDQFGIYVTGPSTSFVVT